MEQDYIGFLWLDLNRHDTIMGPYIDNDKYILLAQYVMTILINKIFFVFTFMLCETMICVSLRLTSLTNLALAVGCSMYT